MLQIDSEVVKEHLAKGGKVALGLALELYGESINEEGDRAFAEAIEIGIENTIAALYEANVEDNDIINHMNKYWGICRDEAIDRLIYEKAQAPIRKLKLFLKMQGLSSKEIQHFMISNKVSIKLKKNPELRELRRKPDKLMKAVKEGE